MSESLSVQVRDSRGKRNCRRARKAGSVPAVLYGQGADNMSLAIPADQVAAVLRHGARLVDLTGAVHEKAFIRDLQWDVYGTSVLHMDLTRISENQMVRVKVVVELRGTAAGIKDGGVVDHHMHELDIDCRVLAIPEKITVSINDLQLDGEITVADLQLPDGVIVHAEPTDVVVQCITPREETEESGTEAGAEPELIGRKAGDEEGDAEE
ncbi:MAG: 50S ribosomal protein L25 [Pirellulales bacterium]